MEKYNKSRLQKLAGLLNENQLPSTKQINDVVDLNFGESGVIKSCKISGVHFDEGKVLYDIDVCITKNTEGKIENTTTIYNVDSIIVDNELSSNN